MFLGIPYNKWHGIISFIVQVVMFVSLAFLFPEADQLMGPGLAFLLFQIIAFLIAHHLQSWNEARQAIDPWLPEKYGDYERFQIDSRDDWRYFYLGSMVSLLANAALAAIIF